MAEIFATLAIRSRFQESTSALSADTARNFAAVRIPTYPVAGTSRIEWRGFGSQFEQLRGLAFNGIMHYRGIVIVGNAHLPMEGVAPGNVVVHFTHLDCGSATGDLAFTSPVQPLVVNGPVPTIVRSALQGARCRADSPVRRTAEYQD